MSHTSKNNRLRLVSFNSTGLGESRLCYIRDMLQHGHIDILLLQETWLMNTNIHKLGTIHKDYLYHGTSAVDESQLLKGRPYGGTAILWRKEFADCVKTLDIPGTKRVSAISVQCSDKTLIICSCYMPGDNYHKTQVSEEFLDTIDKMEYIANKHPSSCIIIGGDMNIDTSRNNAHDKYFCDFIHRNDMVQVWNLPVAKKEYTYCDNQAKVRTCIDHFGISEVLQQSVMGAGVFDNALNPSNHREIFMDLQINVSRLQQTQQQNMQRIAWHRVHGDRQCINAYKGLIDQKLDNIQAKKVSDCSDLQCDRIDHLQEIDEWCEELINCCLECDYVFPRTKSCQGIKPGWTTHVKPFREECLFWSKLWKQSDKPTEGVIYENMRHSKRQYCYAVRRIKRAEKNYRLTRMSESVCENKTRDFFQEIKKMYPKASSPPCINSMSDPSDIAECFASKYKELYNRAKPDNTSMQSVHDYVKVGLIENQSSEEVKIGLDEVIEAVHGLNKDKNDGDKGYNSNHLIYASMGYFKQITHLLQSMLIHGYQPKAILLATVASIPKDNRGNLCCDTNYRGIALSSSISKLFDKVFIQRNIDKLQTSDLQFAYKAKLSTSMCTLTLKEIIKYYLENQSCVYSCFIDATKAFDLIRHDKLFHILIKRRIPAVYLRLIVNLYERQQVRTTWKGCHSESFSVTNGIRQGSIASPLLFCCYMDELLKELQSQGVGCWIVNFYYGAV